MRTCENLFERMEVWQALQEPKMTWETFKRMLPVFDGDADKALLHWRGMMAREVWGLSRPGRREF